MLTSILQAIGLFIATNIDDIIALSLFYARGAGQRGTTVKILLGQYLASGASSRSRCWSHWGRAAFSTGVVVAVLAVVALRLRPSAAVGLVLGGGVANLVDRAGDGRLTDFLSVGWWPTFNLADTAIVIGATWLLLGQQRQERTARPPVPEER